MISIVVEAEKPSALKRFQKPGVTRRDCEITAMRKEPIKRSAHREEKAHRPFATVPDATLHKGRSWHS